jgi:RNA-binding protein YlmH
MRDVVPDDLLEARIREAARLAAGGRARFVGFLDAHGARLAAETARRGRFSSCLLWGGYADAERVMFGAFPAFLRPAGEKFPVAALTAVYRPQERLTHRDFLGALLAAGIERAALGDILAGTGRCVFFCRREIAGFLCSEVTKIGGAGVRISAGAEPPYPERRFAPFSGVIASARLDCAVAAAVGTSREKAAKMIRARLVELNHEPAQAPDAGVAEGDVLSVRGQGRFAIDRLGPRTKKGRLGVAGRKYMG